jgi:RNA polymerase sigma-70 factor (ECF subfamily)
MHNGDWRQASDQALVVAIGRWQQDALAEAYRRHAGAVFGLARRLLSNQTQAEDVTQEVFLRLWHHAEKYDPDRGSLRAFLLTHTHSRAVDLIRSEVSRRRREEGQAVAAGAEGPDRVEHEVQDIIVAEHVRDAMHVLSDDERSAIELAYFAGHTYREVATILGQPEGTVKSRIRAGLRRLREPMEKAGLVNR